MNLLQKIFDRNLEMRLVKKHFEKSEGNEKQIFLLDIWLYLNKKYPNKIINEEKLKLACLINFDKIEVTYYSHVITSYYCKLKTK